MAGGTKSNQGAASMDSSWGQGGGSTAIYDLGQGARRRGQATAMEVPMELDSNEIGNTAALRAWGWGTTSGATRERRRNDTQCTRKGLSGLVRRSSATARNGNVFPFLFASETTEPEVVGHIRPILQDELNHRFIGIYPESGYPQPLSPSKPSTWQPFFSAVLCTGLTLKGYTLCIG
jgi:hypothetical protein